MYEELIAALRFCDGGECDGCCRYTKEEGHSCYTLLRDAADAIEDLSKPRWIPVTERLPEDGSDVLAYLKYADDSRITAANYYKETWQDCVMDGLYRTEEGVVTHWMPPPEPPKEETK